MESYSKNESKLAFSDSKGLTDISGQHLCISDSRKIKLRGRRRVEESKWTESWKKSTKNSKQVMIGKQP